VVDRTDVAVLLDDVLEDYFSHALLTAWRRASHCSFSADHVQERCA
jgi:hypothetical protein